MFALTVQWDGKESMSDANQNGVGPTQPAIRVIMMPKDTNALGTIFGGIILSYIDQAGAVEAHRHGCARLVTVALREVEFHAPVFVGDLVSFFTETLRVGRTSVTVKVVVEAERPDPRHRAGQGHRGRGDLRPCRREQPARSHLPGRRRARGARPPYRNALCLEPRLSP